MKQIILLAILLSSTNRVFSQAEDSVYGTEFIYGAWSDTINSQTGEGFIFSPDSCCSFIVDGEMTECIIESQILKVHYQVKINVVPRQLDILLIDLKQDTVIGVIPMIFEIIDNNHIKLASYKSKSSNRPTDFNQREDVDIAILTRYVENKK